MKKNVIKIMWMLAISLMIVGCSDKNGNEPPKPVTPPEEGGEEEVHENTSALWTEYVEGQKNGTESRLLDFSYAGYYCGEKEIPKVDYPVYDVTDYGAVADDGKSDRDAFVKAIAAAKSNGKGVIYVPAGRFDLRPQDAQNASIIIDCDNIVLRGAGSEAGGTEIFMEYPNEAKDGTLWDSPELISFNYVASTDVEISKVTGDAVRGSHTIEVDNTSGLYIGRRVCLYLRNNTKEAIEDELKPYAADAGWTELQTNGVMVNEYHQIERITGNKVTFKEPIMHKVDSRYGWTLHNYAYHVGCGVEDIAFVGNFTEPFVHHKNALHDSGYRMLTLRRQVNGWIRNCRFTNVSEGASVMQSANVSVLDCKVTGAQGHQAIRSQASSFVLLGRNEDQSGQFHSMGVAKNSAGTVLWKNKSTANTCFESHASQPRATLIDAGEGGFVPNHAGGDEVCAPNHLGDLVIWNYNATGSEGKFDLWSRNNRFVMPIIVGFHGAQTAFEATQVTIDESHGNAVWPESLYEAQLKHRIGYVPTWMESK